MKRMISLLMAAALVLSLVPAGALATETGLCEHHSEHTAECGYIEGTPGSPCSHEHDEECYSSVTQCVHTHDESCGDLEDPAACTHVCSADTGCITTALDCKHQHDETCGYVPAAEGTPCTFVCEICSAAANESAQCICETKCAEGSVNEECPVCAADPSGCTGTETVEEPETPQVTTITEWSWVDSLGALNPEDGKLYLPAAVTEASLAGVTDTLPKSITANGQNIPVSWAYDFNTQTFTASLPEGYVLAEGAAPLTVETVDMGADTLDQEPVGYIDENNQPQTCGEYTEVTGGLTAWSSGWYVVKGDVTIGPRVTVSGDVKLILTDGCNLTVNGGIGIEAGGSLTITAQTKDPNTMGSLEATGSVGNAGIGGGVYATGGNIVINGGSITANGGDGGAGIGSGAYDSCGTITITGGIVKANGGYGGAGIGGGTDSDGGRITINGGNVTATSETGAGIGGGVYAAGGDITINGGTVTATSESGAGIGGGLYGNGGSITITGGSITANGGYNGGAGIGGGYYGTGGTLSGNCGNVIQASSVTADTSGFAGVIQTGTEYRVYGDAVLAEDLTIQPGETLTIPGGPRWTAMEN